MSIVVRLKGFTRTLDEKDRRFMKATCITVYLVIVFAIGTYVSRPIDIDDLASFDILPTKVDHVQTTERHFRSRSVIDRIVVRTWTREYHIDKALYDHTYSTTTVFQNIGVHEPLHIWIRSRSSRTATVKGFRNSRIGVDPSRFAERNNSLFVVIITLTGVSLLTAIYVCRKTYRRLKDKYLRHIESMGQG